MVAAVVTLAGVWAVWPRSPQVGAGEARADQPAKAAVVLPLRGAVSCASVACHNGFGPKGSKGSEYTTWIGQDDKHTRAYQVLFDPRSERIEKNLGNGRKATEDALCLNCHVHPLAGTMSGEALAVVKEDGVSCESCHGAAGKWRTVHYQAGWREKSDDEKKAFGMQPTKNLVERARLCSGCHVGDGERDVNHDLIAAGHPRLTFEFSAFHALMPKHWDEAAEKRTYPDFEARLWMLGQVASAKAALQLLAYRADAKEPPAQGLTKVWPEFAEYQCYACHHDLQAQSWRREREERSKDGTKAKLGTLPWGTWFYRLLAEVPGGPPDSLKRLNELGVEMRKPFPDRRRVADQARALSQQLEPWARRIAEAKPKDATALRKLFHGIARDDKVAQADWDGAAQVYLALAALYHAQRDLGALPNAAAVKSSLKTMRTQLEFPESPLKYDGPQETQYRSRAVQFLEALKAVGQRDQ